MRLRKDRQEERRQEAAKRLESYTKLSAAERVARLDEKLGRGVGAKRQRAKLG